MIQIQTLKMLLWAGMKWHRVNREFMEELIWIWKGYDINQKNEGGMHEIQITSVKV